MCCCGCRIAPGLRLPLQSSQASWQLSTHPTLRLLRVRRSLPPQTALSIKNCDILSHLFTTGLKCSQSQCVIEFPLSVSPWNSSQECDTQHLTMKYRTPPISLALFWVLSTGDCPASGDVSNLGLASGCDSCHGSGGQGYKTFPPIDRLGRQGFIEALHAFKENRRSTTVMDRIAKGYTDHEIERLADIYSSGSASYKRQK